MRRAVLVILALMAPLVASACAINPPRIVAISPGRDAQGVATNQDIRIGFDRTMSHDSVERRFVLSPALAGCTSSPRDCRFAWTNNTLVFLHTHINLDVSTSYTVRLKAGYADASGQANSLDHSWHFTTEGRPSLASVDPPDNATGIAPERNIVLTFSRPMRADTLPPAIQLTPDAAFLLRPKPGGDGSQFEIIPESLLQPNQSYTVSVDRPLDSHGNAIFGRVQSRFKTGSLSLSRKIGYLVGQRDQPAFAVAVVDPHPDAFLGRSTPKLVWKEGDQAVATDAVLSFDWSPDGKRLAVVEAPRSAAEGPVRIVDATTGQVTQLAGQASDVFWSPDGSIVYLTNGALRRYQPGTLQDLPLTEPADGRVFAPISFSPDGKSIAYAAADPQAVTHLWILNVELRTRFPPARARRSSRSSRLVARRDPTRLPPADLGDGGALDLRSLGHRQRRLSPGGSPRPERRRLAERQQHADRGHRLWDGRRPLEGQHLFGRRGRRGGQGHRNGGRPQWVGTGDTVL